MANKIHSEEKPSAAEPEKPSVSGGNSSPLTRRSYLPGTWLMERGAFDALRNRIETSDIASLINKYHELHPDGHPANASPSAPLPSENPDIEKSDEDEGETVDDDENRPYQIDNDGIAHIGIQGTMYKSPNMWQEFFGGCITQNVRGQLRYAAMDPGCRGVMLHIDAPGGETDGTADLASDVAALDQKKPVIAYCEDMCASAAYWVASQARQIWSNSTAMVGCIGTVMSIWDTSKMYSDFGIDVKVIASGGMKGAGTDGAPVTDDQVEYFQSIVDDLTDHFVTGVAQGRKMSPKQAKELADGRVHIGQKAKSAGLVDRIGRKEEARSALKQEIHHMANSQPGADPKLPPTTVKAQDDAAAVKAAADAKAEADAKIKADAEAKAKADLASQSEAVKQKNAYDISNCDAFNDHPQFAREQIRAGHSLEQAMKEFTAMLATENRELRESGPQANRSHVESPSNGGAGYKPRNSASAVTQTGSQSAQTKFRALRDSIRAENPRMTLQQATLKASDRDPTLHAAYLEEAQARSEEVRKARAAYDSARAR